MRIFNPLEDAKQRDDGKKKLELRLMEHPDGTVQKGIFIDGEHFDWEIDQQSYEEAKKMGPMYLKAIHRDIESHFIQSLSEFLNREVTPKQFNEAMKTGWI